jgi:cysteinyl-tRNA synthetase
MVSRRGVFAAALAYGSLVAGFVGGSRRGVADLPTRDGARERLARVKRWGCQYQNIDVDELAQSDLDLVVIDPILDGGTGRRAGSMDLGVLKAKPDGGRRLVLAYLSVGAAEEYRPYWKTEWSEAPPEWLGPADPQWPRSHSVKYWHAEWQSIVLAELERIVEAGFDGVFLDRVDAYHDWRAYDFKQEKGAAMPLMARFVAKLAEAGRRRRADLLLIGQNAEPLLKDPIYLGAIDGVSKESLSTGLNGPGAPNSPDQTAWSLAYLKPVRAAGMKVLTIEYLDDVAAIERVRRAHEGLEFTPFFGSRLLDRAP